jgi:hypothetical protein
MAKKTAPGFYFVGYKDGVENRPKQKLKGVNATAYRNGYADGHRDRSTKNKPASVSN